MNLINELLQLCIEKNATTEHDVFFNFSGHVDGISVTYYKGGFSADSEATYVLMVASKNNSALIQEAINEIKELV